MFLSMNPTISFFSFIGKIQHVLLSESKKVYCTHSPLYHFHRLKGRRDSRVACSATPYHSFTFHVLLELKDKKIPPKKGPVYTRVLELKRTGSLRASPK